MSNLSDLRQQAISAAKSGDWAAAITANQAIIDSTPDDTQALNRLAVAYLQVDDLKTAKKMFQEVIKLDKANIIAKKHLQKLQHNQKIIAPTFTRQHFIEEPGKTTTVELHRLAGKNVLEKVSIGQECTLKLKNRFISISADDTYVGALPEDLSFRLSKLMTKGNTYSCFIRSVSATGIIVHLREQFRSAENKDIHSFPPNKHSSAALNDIVDERLLLDEDVPMHIVHTDSDEPDVDFPDLDSDHNSSSSDDMQQDDDMNQSQNDSSDNSSDD